MSDLLNVSSVMTCPHGGTVTAVTSNTRTSAGSGFALRASDTFTIAGCPFAIGTNPHPCMQVRWVVTDQRSKVVGDFTLGDASVGLCLAGDQAPQGTVLISFTQPRVSGL
jgi:hypothetical protein